MIVPHTVPSACRDPYPPPPPGGGGGVSSTTKAAPAADTGCDRLPAGRGRGGVAPALYRVIYQGQIHFLRLSDLFIVHSLAGSRWCCSHNGKVAGFAAPTTL